MHHTARTVQRTLTKFQIIGVTAFATMTKRNKLAKKVMLQFSELFFDILFVILIKINIFSIDLNLSSISYPSSVRKASE